MVECEYGIYFDIVCEYISIHYVNCDGGHYKRNGGPSTDKNDNCWIHETTLAEAKQITRILSQEFAIKKNGKKLDVRICPQCQITLQ